MKAATLLLLQLFVLLCRTAVVINPEQIRDGTKTDVENRTIIQRASGDGGDLSPTSDLGGSDILRSFYFNIRPGGRVLGPPDRLFDWDVSCSDPTERQKIWDAYNMALKLAEDAEGKLVALAKELPKTPTNTEQTENQNWIAQQDPA